MEINTHKWESTIFIDFNDSLIIQFETSVEGKEPEYSVSTKMFWKRNKHNMYLTEIFISTPCKIDYTFKNGMSIRGTIEIQKINNFQSNDSLGIFADFYYYNNESNNYLQHTEGFLISFDPGFPIQKDNLPTNN